MVTETEGSWGMKHTISKKFILLWQIRVTFLLIPGGLVSGAAGSFSAVFLWIFPAGLVASYLFLMLWYLPKSREHMFFFLLEEGVSIYQGVFFQKNYTVEKKSLVYIRRSSTPLQRAMGLCSITFYTAGARVRLSCLSENTYRLVRQSFSSVI